MTDSLEFYVALYIVMSPVIFAAALIIFVALIIPVYLIDTRKEK